MARYGFSLYGLPKYGKAFANQLYYRSDISSLVIDYGKVYLSWDTIDVDPSDPSPTHWKLVRSYTGVPMTPDDATTLIGGPLTSFVVSYIDNTAAAVPDTEVHYSLWLFNAQEWVFCGSTTTLAIAPTDSLKALTRRLPAVWLNSVNGVGDATGEAESSNELVEFLSALVLEHDALRLKTKLIYEMSDYRKIPANLLPAALAGLGMPEEPALGTYSQRSLYRVGHIINSTKGTTRGLALFTSALTHWGNKVLAPKNLMLSHDDSSFENTTGQWTIDNTGTITRHLYSAQPADIGVNIYPPAYLNDPHVTLKSTAFAVVKPLMPEYNRPITMQALTNLIPVKELTAYTFSFYHAFVHVEPFLELKVTSYDRNKTPTNVGTFTLANSTSLGTPVDAQGVPVHQWFYDRQNFSVPYGAVWIGLEIIISPFSGPWTLDALVAFDRIQLEQGPNGTAYHDARTVALELDADRTNLLPNPGFDHDMGGWYPKNAYVQSRPFNAPNAYVVFGSSAAELVSRTAGTPALISEWVNVKPGAPITFSAYVSGVVGRTAVARIEFTTPQSTTAQTAVLSDADGQYFPLLPEIVDGTPVTIADSATRVHVTAHSPALVADNGSAMAKVSIYFPDVAEVGETFYIDGCLLEHSALLQPFFQGNGAPAPANPVTDPFVAPNDCRWESREVVNMMPYPLMDNIGDIVVTAGTITAVNSAVGVPAPPFGGSMVKLDQSNGMPAWVTIPFNVDSYATEGLDVAISIYVTGFDGTVSISGPNSQNAIDFAINESGPNAKWVRVHTAVPMSGSAQINLTIYNASGTTGYLSAPSANFGRIPLPYMDGNLGYPRRNRLGGTQNVYTKHVDLIGCGRSYHWRRYFDKYSRLSQNLPDILPIDTSAALISGEPSREATNSASLLKNGSFENDLSGWVLDLGFLHREVAQGSHFNDYGLHGSSFCRVECEAGVALFSSDRVAVTPQAGYYLSLGIKPLPTQGTLVPSTVDAFISWYDAAGVFLANTALPNLVPVTRSDRWTYIGLTAKNVLNVGAPGTPDIRYAAFASVTINFVGANAFLIDRVLFRQ